MRNVSQYKYLYAILTEPFLSGSVKVLLWQMVPQNFTSVAGLEVNLPAMTHTLGVTPVLVIMTSPLLSYLVHYFLISLFVILFLPCHSWFKVLLIRLASLLAKMLLPPKSGGSYPFKQSFLLREGALITETASLLLIPAAQTVVDPQEPSP